MSLARGLSPETTAAQTELDRCRASLPDYVTSVHGWQAMRHHRIWCEALTDDGRDLLIVAPPSSAKTSWVGVGFVEWWLGHHLTGHVIYCGNTASQAVKQAQAIRDTVASEAYGRIFPDRRVGRPWGDAGWALANRPLGDKDYSLTATGIGGPILGARADLIVMDDVSDQENTATHYMREKGWDWVRKTLFSRRRDYPTPRTRIVMICTRWHDEDIAGHVKKALPNIRVIEMPVLGAPGFEDMDRGCLWPEMYPEDVLERQRMMDPRGWQGMYMARPGAEGGNIWKTEYWRYFEQPPRISYVLQSYDTAFQESQSADYTVGTTWGVGEHGYYVLDMVREKWEFPAMRVAVEMQAEMHRPNVVLVEDKASGQSLLQVLRSETRLPIVAVKADKSKEARAWGVVGLAQAGLVWLPAHAPWLADFEREMAAFPNGAHDDIVDSTCHALAWLRRFGAGHLTAGSDADEKPEQDEDEPRGGLGVYKPKVEVSAEIGHGNKYEPGAARGSDMAGYKASRWGAVRGRRR